MLNATLKIAWVVFKRIFKLNSEVETTNIFKLGDDGGVVDLMVHQTEGNIGVLCLKAEARGLCNLLLKIMLPLRYLSKITKCY